MSDSPKKNIEPTEEMNSDSRKRHSKENNEKVIELNADNTKSPDRRKSKKSSRRSLSRSGSRERSDRRRRSGSRDKLRKSRDHDRHRDYDRDRDRDRHSRRRSRSPKRDSRDRPRDKRRSRSRSKSRSRSLSPVSRRMKVRQEAQAAKAKAGGPQRFWDGFQWVDQLPNRPLAAAAAVGLGALPIDPIALNIGNQKDRRVYVGNLPPNTTPEQLKEFMNAAMLACGGVPAGIPNAVLSIWMGPENKYSFVEMCTAETAAVAMGLTGIAYQGVNLRIARPKTYSDASMASGAGLAVATLAGGVLPGLGIGLGLGLGLPPSSSL